MISKEWFLAFFVRLFPIQFIGCPYKNWWFCIKFRSAVVSMRCWEQRRAGRPNLVHTQILSDQGTKPCKSGLVLQCLVQISNAVVDWNNTVLRHSSYNTLISFFLSSVFLIRLRPVKKQFIRELWAAADIEYRVRPDQARIPPADLINPIVLH